MDAQEQIFKDLNDPRIAEEARLAEQVHNFQLIQSTSSKDLKEALSLAIRREKAKRTLLRFTKYTFPEYMVARHNEMIAEYLDAWVEGVFPRLMVFTPPRHGKSELASRRLPAYIQGKVPGSEVLAASYSADLAILHSRHAKAIVESKEFSELFPHTQLYHRKAATEEWETIYKPPEMISRGEIKIGSYKCSGIGGGITGRGFNFGIIDDPVKDRKEAESPVIRESIWQWYTSTFYTRKAPKARILLIMTRWHQDDLAGRLLNHMKEGGDFADKWTVLNLEALSPGENDPLQRPQGEPLWPDRYPISELQAIRSNIGIYDWSALYCGKPVPSGGELIQRDWFTVVDEAPEGLKWYRFWDLAVSSKDTAHRTASIAMARTEDGEYYLKDLISHQKTWPQTKRVMAQTCEGEGKSTRVGIEDAAQQKGFIDELIDDTDFAKFSITGIRPDADKKTRALPWIAKAEAGRIYLVRGPWISNFLDICQSFTGIDDARDDEIDAVSGAYRMTTDAIPPKIRVM